MMRRWVATGNAQFRDETTVIQRFGLMPKRIAGDTADGSGASKLPEPSEQLEIQVVAVRVYCTYFGDEVWQTTSRNGWCR